MVLVPRIYKYNSLSQHLEPTNHLGPNIEPTVEGLMTLKHERAHIMVNGAEVSDLLYPRVERLFADEARHKEKLKYHDFAQLAQHKKDPPITKDLRLHWDPDLKAKAIQMLKGGKAATDISVALNVPYKTVYTWGYKLGINPSQVAWSKNPIHETPTAPVPERGTMEFRKHVLKYLEDNPSLPQREVTTKFGIALSTIWYWRKTMGPEPKKEPKAPNPSSTPVPMLSPPVAPSRPCQRCIALEAEVAALRDDSGRYKKLLIRELK